MRASRVIVLLVLCAALNSAALAQKSKRPPKLEPLPEPPPPPEMVDEPAVNIPVPQGHQVEEMRDGGRVVALRITPPGGKPYYLIDTTGNGNWMRRDSLDDGVRVPMWPIYTFD